MTSSVLNAVSCPSTSTCVAVGESNNGVVDNVGGGADNIAVAEVWDGTGWTYDTTANPAGAASGDRSGGAAWPARAR